MQEVPSQPEVRDYMDHRSFLADLYSWRKAQKKRYNYEAFAEELGFGHNNYLYQIIHGHRNLTEKAAKRIASGIPIRNWDRAYFLAIVGYNEASSSRVRDQYLARILDLRMQVMESELDRSLLEYFSEWYHPVVRELVVMPDFVPDPGWIASHVHPKIDPERAAASFSLLQRIGYLQFDVATQKWQQTQPVISMPQEVASLGLLQFHRAMMERARESLQNTPPLSREIGAITLSLSQEGFVELKGRLQEFRKEVRKRFGESSGNLTGVFQLNVQLFPVSKLEKRK